MTTTTQGSEVAQVAAVEVIEAGGNALGDHPAGATTIRLDDASDFPELGGTARVGDTVVDVAAADPEANTLTLAAGLPATVEDGDRVFVDPPAPTTWAQVIIDPEEGALLAEVPFGLKAFTGITEGDLVRVVEDPTSGVLQVVEVIGGTPTLNAELVDDADNLLLASRMKTLRETLDANDAALEQARTNLESAQARLDQAFGQIDLLPDEAYVAAAKQQAIDAAAADATAKAEQAKADAAADAKVKADHALSDAKAYTVQQVGGLGKLYWSTSLPGTTTAAQNSTWYQVDAAGGILAVLTQTAAGTGSTWTARPLRSELFDTIDAAKLSIAGNATIRDAVVQQMAVQLATIIKADIGNLTVTGTSHLNEVVAKVLGADVAAFIQLTADQILAGNIKVALTLSTDGKIIAGSPTGAAVELTRDGITIWDVDADGVRYASTAIGGPGADSLWITDASGQRLAGFAEDGTVTGTSASFARDPEIAGDALLGKLGDVSPLSGANAYLERVAWGVIARQIFSQTTTPRAAGEEWGYASIGATVYPGRVYRVGATATAKSGSSSGFVRCRLRVAQGGADVTVSSPLEGVFDLYAPGTSFVYGGGVGYLSVSSTQDIALLLTYYGAGGGTATMSDAELWIEDVGPSGSYGGGSLNTGGQSSGGGMTGTPTKTVRTYTSVWRANDSATFDGSGAKRTQASGDIIQGYNAANGVQKGAFAFTGGAVSGETGKTKAAALTGATVKSVRIFLYANHTYFGSGATLSLQRASNGSIPSTWGGVTRQSGSKDFSIKANEGKWVTVDTSWAATSVFVLAYDSTSGNYYARVNGHTDAPSYYVPAIEVTYER